MPAQTFRFERWKLVIMVSDNARNAVIAVKLDIIEGCGDAMPARHSGGFRSANARHCGSDNVAEAQGLADQNDFKLDGGANCQLPGTKKIDSRGAMLRVTALSEILRALRRHCEDAFGRFRLARGYSRCSGCTPTAYVGTRTKRRRLLGTKKRRQTQRRYARPR